MNTVTKRGWSILTLIIIGIASQAFAQEVEVVFQVDMNQAIQYEQFDPDLHTVYLRGSFNDWSQSDVMSDDDGNGVFELTKNLVIGTHEYKFFATGIEFSNDGWEEDGEQTSNRIVEIDRPTLLSPVFFRNTFDDLSSNSTNTYIHLFVEQSFIYADEQALSPPLQSLIFGQEIHSLEVTLSMSTANGDFEGFLPSSELEDAGWTSRHSVSFSDELSYLTIAMAGSSPLDESLQLGVPEISSLTILEDEEARIEIIDVKINEVYEGGLSILNGGIFRSMESSIRKGDLNGDRVIDQNDIVAIIDPAFGLSPTTQDVLLRGDITGDGTISMVDTYLLSEYVFEEPFFDPEFSIESFEFDPFVTGFTNGDGNNYQAEMQVASINNLLGFVAYVSYSNPSIQDAFQFYTNTDNYASFTRSQGNQQILGGYSQSTEKNNPLLFFDIQTNQSSILEGQFAVIDSLKFNEQATIVLQDTLFFDFLFPDVLGDLSDDGFIDGTDLTAMQRYALRLEGASEFVLERADLTGDGTISLVDMYNLNRFITNGDALDAPFIPTPVFFNPSISEPEVDLTESMVRVGVSVDLQSSLVGFASYVTLSDDALQTVLSINMDETNFEPVTALNGFQLITGGFATTNERSDNFLQLEMDISNLSRFENQYVVFDSLSFNEQPSLVLNDTLFFDFLFVSNESENSIQQPKEITLDQNYPNPFNPSTQVSFSLPEAQQVRLSVYSMLGQEVAVLVNESVPAGTHVRTFNASQLSSGIYVYRLQTGTRVLIRQMVLVK